METDRTEISLVHVGWTEEKAMIRDIMYEGWGYITEDFRTKMGGNNGGYLS